ncbi:hypothetical protein Pelo_16962 [Pelomyxa schiedti]|nr:hypothetical protein Pelo_16962 [Pelomyxa schiedti]
MDPGDVHTKQLLEEAGDLIRAIVLCGRGQLPQCRDFCLSLIRPLSAKDPVFFPLVIALLRSVCAHEPALMPSHNREGLREHYKNLIRGCDNSFGRESVRIGDSIICHFRKERTRIEMEESQLPSPGYSCNDVTDNGENGTNTSISIIRNNNSSVDSRRALGVSLYNTFSQCCMYLGRVLCQQTGNMQCPY